MADVVDETGAETADAPSATARVEIVDDLPGERTVFPVEVEGELIWLVRRGQMSEELCDELNGYLTGITDRGLWVQRWGGPAGDPPQLRQAS